MSDPHCTVHVPLGENAYAIDIAAGALGAESSITLRATGRAFIIVDSEVTFGLPKLRTRLAHQQVPIAAELSVPSGERSKSWQQLQRLCEELLEAGIRRDDTIVLLGGGVVGDLGGLAAALVLRGVGFIQIPTTLLAMIDSSVGGKLAINAHGGKNLVGVFAQPRQVVIDTDWLQTLPTREIAAGFAEMVKYGVLGDANFFYQLEQDSLTLRTDHRSPELIRAIEHCCAMKATIVGEDEKESGRRALLNLGHTFGHALEAMAFADPSTSLLHGEAVAVGMVMAGRAARGLGMAISDADCARIDSLLRKAGLPTSVRDVFPNGTYFDAKTNTTIAIDAACMAQHMLGDKKASAKGLMLILPHSLGEAVCAPGFRIDSGGDGEDGNRDLIQLLEKCMI